MVCYITASVLCAVTWCKPSHARVRRPAAALGHDPVDVLRGALDVARLAVDAVLRVDLGGAGGGVRVGVARPSVPRAQLASVPLSAGPVYSSKLPVVLTRRLCDICTKTIVQATQRRRCGHHWRDPPPARRRRGGGSRTHQELHSDVGRAIYMITSETVSA